MWKIQLALQACWELTAEFMSEKEIIRLHLNYLNEFIKTLNLFNRFINNCSIGYTS